jgi:hypothetical protein
VASEAGVKLNNQTEESATSWQQKCWYQKKKSGISINNNNCLLIFQSKAIQQY